MVKMVAKKMAYIRGQKDGKNGGQKDGKIGEQKDGNHLDGMQYLSPATSYYHSDVNQTRPYMGTMTMNA